MRKESVGLMVLSSLLDRPTLILFSYFLRKWEYASRSASGLVHFLFLLKEKREMKEESFEADLHFQSSFLHLQWAHIIEEKGS